MDEIVVKRIEELLDNLSGVCSNNLKACLILEEIKRIYLNKERYVNNLFSQQ